MKITVPFLGHKNILSLHEKTIEITKDSELTTNGDCIVGVGADISCIDLPEKMKKKIQNPKTKILFSIEANDKKFIINGYGSEKLSLKHTKDIVLRKSALFFVFCSHSKSRYSPIEIKGHAGLDFVCSKVLHFQMS